MLNTSKRFKIAYQVLKSLLVENTMLTCFRKKNRTHKKTWDTLYTLKGCEAKSCHIEHLNSAKSVVKDDEGIANTINKYCCEIGSKFDEHVGSSAEYRHSNVRPSLIDDRFYFSL